MRSCTSQDRLDRDRLERAARRADNLLNMFVGDMRDLTQGPLWIAEIKSGVEQVTNPKAAAALRDAAVARPGPEVSHQLRLLQIRTCRCSLSVVVSELNYARRCGSTNIALNATAWHQIAAMK